MALEPLFVPYLREAAPLTAATSALSAGDGSALIPLANFSINAGVFLVGSS